MKIEITEKLENHLKYSIGDVFYSTMIPVRNWHSPSDIFYRVRTNNGVILVKDSQLKVIGEDDDYIEKNLDSGILAAESIKNLQLIDDIKGSKLIKIMGNDNKTSVNCRFVVFYSLGTPCGWMTIDNFIDYLPIKIMNTFASNIDSSIFIEKFLMEEKEPFLNIYIDTDYFEAIYNLDVKVVNTTNDNLFNFGKLFLPDLETILNIKS